MNIHSFSHPDQLPDDATAALVIHNEYHNSFDDNAPITLVDYFEGGGVVDQMYVTLYIPGSRFMVVEAALDGKMITLIAYYHNDKLRSITQIFDLTTTLIWTFEDGLRS